MMKVLVFNVPTSGHVDPTLPLTAELVSRGHEVIYYLTEGYRERVEMTGAVYRETPGISGDYFEEVSRKYSPLRLATILLNSTYDLLGPLVDVVKEEGPDFVVFDSMCPWGRLAAELAGVTSVSSMSLINVPASYLLRSGKMGMFLRIIPRLFGWYRPYRKAIRRLEERFGVRFDDLYGVLNATGDININYTSDEIYPQSEKLDDSYLFIGPSIGYGLSEVAFPFEELDDDRPLIYVSLGTVFNDNPDFFKECIKAFRDSEFQVVISLGKRLPVSALGEIPDNFIVRNYVPQLAILEKASLYISHGGVNSVHQSLYHGVPLAFVPQQLEQAVVSVRMEELGVGIIVRNPKDETLREAAKRVLGDRSFRERAASLGVELKEAGGVKAAADRLEELK